MRCRWHVCPNARVHPAVSHGRKLAAGANNSRGPSGLSLDCFDYPAVCLWQPDLLSPQRRTFNPDIEGTQLRIDVAFQVQDDELFGVPIPPDGRRTKNAQLGPILNYDIPVHNSSIKVKALTTVLTENTVKSWAVVFGWIKKF